MSNGWYREQDFDPRNHRSLLIPGYERESLVDLDEEAVAMVNPLMFEVDEFLDEDLERFCWRFVAMRTGKNAKRATLVASVARSDEQVKHMESENRPQEPI